MKKNPKKTQLWKQVVLKQHVNLQLLEKVIHSIDNHCISQNTQLGFFRKRNHVLTYRTWCIKLHIMVRRRRRGGGHNPRQTRKLPHRPRTPTEVDHSVHMGTTPIGRTNPNPLGPKA